MPAPRQQPIGLQLQRTAKELGRAFDDALADAGGSGPVWLIVLSLKSGRATTQKELADAVGVKAATMTHHLDALERDGVVERVRDPANRRVLRPTLTKKGDELFERLREAAVAFDTRIRQGIGDEDEQRLRALLERLRANATEP
jgi:MarR family transcriptional regulator, transcriptional regulator for hemolysin